MYRNNTISGTYELMIALTTDHRPNPIRAIPAIRFTHNKTFALRRFPSQCVINASTTHHSIEPQKIPVTIQIADPLLLTPAPANIPKKAKIVTGLDRVNKKVVR